MYGGLIGKFHELTMPRAPKSDLRGLFEEDFLPDELTALNTEFANWETADGKGTHQLWSLLGKVYQLGERIEGNGTAKWDLIRRVAEDQFVKDNPHWNPETKTSHELLLVLLLSIKEETKAKKSQWFSAIRAAKKASVPTTQAGFVDYIEKVGGIDKARKSIARSPRPKPDFAELVEEMEGYFNPERPGFQAPDTFNDQRKLPGGIGIVLVKGNFAGASVTPLATICDKKIVEHAILRLLAEGRSVERSYRREFEDEWYRAGMNVRPRVLAAWRSREGSPVGKSHPLEFREFVEEQLGEDEELMSLDKKIPDLLNRLVQGHSY